MLPCNYSSVDYHLESSTFKLLRIWYLNSKRRSALTEVQLKNIHYSPPTILCRVSLSHHLAVLLSVSETHLLSHSLSWLYGFLIHSFYSEEPRWAYVPVFTRLHSPSCFFLLSAPSHLMHRPKNMSVNIDVNSCLLVNSPDACSWHTPAICNIYLYRGRKFLWRRGRLLCSNTRALITAGKSFCPWQFFPKCCSIWQIIYAKMRHCIKFLLTSATQITSLNHCWWGWCYFIVGGEITPCDYVGWSKLFKFPDICGTKKQKLIL